LKHGGRGLVVSSAFFAAVIVARADDVSAGLRVLLLAWFILVSIALVGRMCAEAE